MARVVSMCVALGLLLLQTGCEKSTKKPNLDGPVTVMFGDCAGPTARFESGPRPQQFDLAEVEAQMAQLATGGPLLMTGPASPATSRPNPPGSAFAPLTGTTDFASSDDDLGDEPGTNHGFGEGGTGWGTIGADGAGTTDLDPAVRVPDAGAPAAAPARRRHTTVFKDYIAGNDNPLRSHGDALKKCFADHGKARYAAVVIDMTVGADGAISGAATHGLDGKVAECVAKVANKATWAGAEARAYRCPLAFGPMPVGSAPGVDITEQAITFTADDGATPMQVGDPRTVMADTSPEWRLDELFEILIKRQAKRLGMPKRVVSISGPAMVRPIETTPMKVVLRATKTMQAADLGPVLAIQTDAGWTVLMQHEGPRDGALPIAPVPVGTGAAWSPLPIPGSEKILLEEEAVRISVLVRRDDIWVGISRVNDFRQIRRANGDYDWTALRQTLAEHKASSFFIDRLDIEIGAEDDALYHTVARVVQDAFDAGFTDWELTDPASLSARPQL